MVVKEKVAIAVNFHTMTFTDWAIIDSFDTDPHINLISLALTSSQFL